MWQDNISQVVKKILNDKILLGLLIVCLLGIFVGGFNYNQGSQRTKETDIPAESTDPATSKPDSYNQVGGLTPELAVQFVKWWVKPAMDYTPASAAQSHQAANNWMTPDALKSFDEAFWSPELAKQVTAGAVIGAFQPIAVQAKAINPDKSIVVTVIGTLVLEMGSRPGTHQIEMDILVRRSNTGLRIAGLYNRLTSLSSSVY